MVLAGGGESIDFVDCPVPISAPSARLQRPAGPALPHRPSLGKAFSSQRGFLYEEFQFRRGLLDMIDDEDIDRPRLRFQF